MTSLAEDHWSILGTKCAEMARILVSSLSDTSLRVPFEYLTPGGGGYGDQKKGGLLLEHYEEDLHHIRKGIHITPRTMAAYKQT